MVSWTVVCCNLSTAAPEHVTVEVEDTSNSQLYKLQGAEHKMSLFMLCCQTITFHKRHMLSFVPCHYKYAWLLLGGIIYLLCL